MLGTARPEPTAQSDDGIVIKAQGVKGGVIWERAASGGESLVSKRWPAVGLNVSHDVAHRALSGDGDDAKKPSGANHPKAQHARGVLKHVRPGLRLNASAGGMSRRHRGTAGVINRRSDPSSVERRT
eukprot:16438708-Heterocapsa_arctica.AAC.1